MDFEIRGLHDELAAIVMNEVLSKKGSFSIYQAKDKSSIDPEKAEMIKRLL
jgi:hypothetical protein